MKKWTGVFSIAVFLLINIVFMFMDASVARSMDYSVLKKYSFNNRLMVHKLEIKTGIIYRLDTSEGYVSVITLPSIPLTVAIGDKQDFSEQTVGRRLFVKPITYNTGVTSNMEILTKFGLVNILLRIVNPGKATYNLDLSQGGKDIFESNYIKYELGLLKKRLLAEYKTKFTFLKKEENNIKKEKREVISLLLSLNKVKVNKSTSMNGVTFTIISVSRIKGIYYIYYRITNNNRLPFFLKGAVIYRDCDGGFINGYTPETAGEIWTVNSLPENKSFQPFSSSDNIAVFKKSSLKNYNYVSMDVDGIMNSRPVRLSIACPVNYK